jgi:hypothetical protein
MTPKEAATKLIGLRNTLARPLPFYELVLEPWRDMAGTIARDILSELRPASVTLDPVAEAEHNARWRLACEAVRMRVQASLFAAEDVGIILSLAAKPVVQEGDPRTFAIGDVSVLDVERWVRESRAGNLNSDVEKQIDERDTGKSDLQIAWRILYAMLGNKPGRSGLETAIKKYLGAQAWEDSQKLYPEVLKGWLDYFVPIAINQFRAWVGQRVADA